MKELILVNPRRRKRRKKRTLRRRRVYRRKRRNPAPVVMFNPRRRRSYRRRTYRRRSYRRNPKLLGQNVNMKQVFEVTGGALGSRLLASQLLGLFKMTSQGLTGYVGDIGAGFLLAKLSRMVFRARTTERNILLGAWVNVASRVLNDIVSGTSLIGRSPNLSTLSKMIPSPMGKTRFLSAGAGTRFGSRFA